MEVELKLQIAADAVEAVASSPLLGGEPTILHLEATYFDTPEQHLRKNGFSLRIRRENEHLIQTLKGTSKSAVGLFARPEWEQSVESLALVINDKTPLTMLLGDAIRTLAPVFRVVVERRTWKLIDGEDVVECALDVGDIVASDRRSPLCELELEITGGGLAYLFRLARQLDEVTPIRLGTNSKSERGYLSLEALPDSFKAEPVELVATMTAQAAFQAIITNCLKQFRLNETQLLDTRSALALHQARIALRRLRAAFTIFRPLYADGQAETIRRDLKWLATLLGEGRDLDVLLKRDEAQELRERLQSARDQAYDRIIAALEGKRARMLMLDVVEWAAMGAWLASDATREERNRPAPSFAAKPLRKLRKKVKKNGKDLDKLDESARHEVRKDAKKLRYASEFFADLFREKRQRRRHGTFVAALEGLQAELGALNDLAAAPALIQSLGLADNVEAKALLAGGKKKKRLAAAVEAHGTFVDAKRFWE